MFVSPVRVIEEGWITHPECKSLEDWKTRKFVSPNAIDFTCDNLYVLKDKSEAFLDDYTMTKTMREMEEVVTLLAGNGLWKLKHNYVYDCASNMHVIVPQGYAALLYPRSTLTRNGLFIANGIFDQGFRGGVGTTIHVQCGDFTLGKGTRIGQIAFFKSEDSGIVYAGGYNTQQGQHWASK